MKLAITSYPFAVYSESKKSKKTGNDYTATSIKFTTKDVNGEKVSTYFNLFDKRELLVLANLCGRAFAKIDEMAFYKCTNLSDIELPSGLLSIGSRAFFGCTGLSDIIIPENVETIGSMLFQECTQVNIYVKQEKQPIGWAPNWNHLNIPVVWGYTDS